MGAQQASGAQDHFIGHSPFQNVVSQAFIPRLHAEDYRDTSSLLQVRSHFLINEIGPYVATEREINFSPVTLREFTDPLSIQYEIVRKEKDELQRPS